MRFSWLKNNTDRKFAYAFKDLNFDGFEKEICTDCGRIVSKFKYRSHCPVLLVEGGTEMPDLLQFCGAGKRLFLVSQKALDVFQKNIIEGYDICAKVHWMRVNDASCLEESGAEVYYSLEITGAISLDLEQMQLRQKRLCKECGEFEWSRQKLGPYILQESSWDGSDLCYIKQFPGMWVCTTRFKEIMINNQLTGFCFKDV